MNAIQQNIEAVQQAYDAVKGHCMCRQIFDDGTYYRVIYPEGDWPGGKHGAQCSYGIYAGRGKEWALKRLLDQMEKDWTESYPGHKA